MKKLMVVAAATWLTGAACVHAGPGAADRASLSPVSEPVRVDDTDNYALPMEIYVNVAGNAYRLGLVYPGLASRFTLPQGMVAEGNRVVEFVAQPSGYGPVVRTGEMKVEPGDVVAFVVMTNLIGSHADVTAPYRR